MRADVAIDRLLLILIGVVIGAVAVWFAHG